eukprot:CAMPEP_0198260370 /NCGR_PEP_ID=MMETSP1447-20131203/9365_1 /TAXON_ID=420782 /ORGANISM="Chaetoceros dichaeta, Strain CCMP1751" /LENGTH=521 /DNA_ID=CAMNT_0043948017 /DNA_START=130 /DNA_END=1695 /DNA_ORIENTATION=+
MIHSSAQKMSRSTSRIRTITSNPAMRVLQVIQRRQQTTIITTNHTNHTRNKNNRLVQPRCGSSVFSPRWFHTPTTAAAASLSSFVSSSSSSSSAAALASVSHLRSTKSSSSSNPSTNWQTNLLLVGGAGSLLASSYGTNNNSNTEQSSVSRCDDTEAEPTTTKSTPTMESPTSNDTTDDDDVDDDEDETHCTICLINRQGPCRLPWRKFERCMKDHSKQNADDTDDTSSPISAASTMGEKCDGHMMPWITCIQSHRNTYTLISNKFFQDEFVDLVEGGIAEQDKVCLGGGGSDGSSSSIDWKQFVEFQTDGWLDETEEPGSNPLVVAAAAKEEDPDALLVEGVARINLWDGDGTRRVDLAYVRDQDGLLLGHERFTNRAFEDETSGGGEGGGDDDGNTNDDGTNNKSDSIRAKPTVGHCSFHVSPGSTTAIQIFAIYGSKHKSDEYGSNEGVNDTNPPVEEETKTNTDSGTIIKEEEKDKKRGTQTLYYSGLIPLGDLKPPSRIKEQSGPGIATDEKGLTE